MQRKVNWTSPRPYVFGTSLMACAILSPLTAYSADEGHGLALAEQWCNSCHSIGNDVPRQEDAGPLFTELAKQDAAYLEVAINKPHDFMPEFPKLSDADKADVIAYILSLKE